MGAEGQERGLTLLLDADDTLWENNCFFEKAIASFISMLDGSRHSPAEIRNTLNRIEHETIRRCGYGTESFRQSLLQCFEEIAEQHPSEAEHARVMSFVDVIVTSAVELLPGVQPALETLAGRHRLLLVTKGDDLEQREKLQRSGLQPFFSAVEVLPEKHEDAYRELAGRHGCDAERTWMIGNSPKSDINPALRAGLHAVFVPHGSTWELEQEELLTPPQGQRLLRVESLLELAALL